MPPVSVEESKAQRILRQQARFRDRGGAFVPSEKNPLIDILLSRTISGESPSKLATRSRSRSISPSKAKRHKKTSKPLDSSLKVKDLRSNSNSNTEALNINAVSGPSTESGGNTAKMETKKRVGPTRKGKGKTKTNGDEVLEAEKPKAKSAPKCKGRPPKTKPRASDLDTNADPDPPTRKTKASKAKPADKLRSKIEFPEVIQSDDEGTLVEAPQLKSRSKRKPVVVTINSDGEDEFIPDKLANAERRPLPKSAYKRPSPTKDAPLHRAQAKQRTEALKDQSSSKPTASTEASRMRKHLKPEDTTEGSPNPMKFKTYGSVAIEIPMKKSAISCKRSAPDGEDVEQPTKRAKVNKLHSARSLPLSNSPATSKPDVEDSTVKKPSSAMKKDTKQKKERPPESDDDDHPPKRPPLKRARFVEEPKPLVQISSEKQKENIVSRKMRAEKPTSKSKSRGPPKGVLDRIKATATLQQVDDSAPDPLDCLS